MIGTEFLSQMENSCYGHTLGFSDGCGWMGWFQISDTREVQLLVPQSWIEILFLLLEKSNYLCLNLGLKLQNFNPFMNIKL